MNHLKELEELLGTNYNDLEAEVYTTQKKALENGIFLIPQVKYKGINPVYSHEILNDYEKNIRYVLNKIILLQNYPKIRGHLGRPLFFKDDICEFTLLYKNQEISIQKTQINCVVQTRLDKLSFEDLINFLTPNIPKNELGNCQILVKLLQPGETRIQAEEFDFISQPEHYASQIKSNLVEKLDLLNSTKKIFLFQERLKLWGIFNQEISKAPCLCPSDFGIKDLFYLTLIDYNFLRDATNEEVLTVDPLFKSYHKKLLLLSEVLKKPVVILEARLY